MKCRGIAALGAALAVIAMTATPTMAASPNSGKIAFAAGNPLHVWTVKPNGKGLRDLNAGAPAGKTYCSPALSPDGTRIAYIDAATPPPIDAPHPNESSPSSIVIANSDGTNARVVPNADEYGYFCLNELAWAPDGHHLAFPGYVTTDPRPDTDPGGFLSVINADNPLELPRRIGDATAYVFYTAFWSLDGSRLAADGDDGHTHIFRLDGGPSVTSADYHCHLSGWAPSSARLLQTCEGPPWSTDAQGVWSVDANDLVSRTPVYLGAAGDGVYSPDGSRIAMRLDGQLATMPADGSAAPTVLVDRTDVYGISWSG